MTEALRGNSSCAGAFRETDVVGVAASFRCFGTQSVTVAADTAGAAGDLIRTVAQARQGILLAVSREQVLPERYERLPWTTDAWLQADCTLDDAAESQTDVVTDSIELAAFYQLVRMRYWCPAMLESHPARAVRLSAGAIAAAVSVQFVLGSVGYAHLGALVTAPEHRGRGLARTTLAAIRSSLARLGVKRVGLFAEAAHPWLVEFYERVGFAQIGAFRFVEVDRVR